jgi:hypothetical protein
MSHNKTTVANQNPDSSGNITLTTSNLTDTNISSPSANEVLKWDGAQWINSAAPAGSSEYLLIGQGGSSNYSNSNQTGSMTSGHKLELYDANPINTLGATITANANDWVSTVQLPAGRYMTILNVNLNFLNTGYVEYEIEDTSNNKLSYSAVIGDDAYTYMKGGSTTISNYLNLSSATTIRVNLVTVSSNALQTVTNQGTTISENSVLFIMKVA